MLTVEDFTKLSPGAQAPVEGQVERCPLCGRCGVASNGAPGPYFLHVQTLEVIGDGMRVVPRDFCLL